MQKSYDESQIIILFAVKSLRCVIVSVLRAAVHTPWQVIRSTTPFKSRLLLVTAQLDPATWTLFCTSAIRDIS